MRFKKTIKSILFFLLFTNLIQNVNANGKFTDWVYENFEFLPEYHIEVDLQTFFFHKTGYFHNKYLLENNTNLDLVFLSFRNVFYSVWYFEFQNGMGRKGKGNVLFDPAEINYGLVPIFELRIKNLYYHLGMNHHCFHEIDQKEQPVVYWNKMFAGIGSKNMRQEVYWQNLKKENGWSYRNRFSWYFTGNYYVKKFFGIVRETKINGHNRNSSDYTLEARWAFLRTRSWLINLRGNTCLGYWKSMYYENPKINGNYWRQDFSVDLYLRKANRGGMLFLTYTLDDLPLTNGLPRFSKDNLLQLGIRFFI